MAHEVLDGTARRGLRIHPVGMLDVLRDLCKFVVSTGSRVLAPHLRILGWSHAPLGRLLRSRTLLPLGTPCLLGCRTLSRHVASSEDVCSDAPASSGVPKG